VLTVRITDATDVWSVKMHCGCNRCVVIFVIILWIEHNELCAIVKGSVIKCSWHMVNEIVQTAYYDCVGNYYIPYMCVESEGLSSALVLSGHVYCCVFRSRLNQTTEVRWIQNTEQSIWTGARESHGNKDPEPGLLHE